MPLDEVHSYLISSINIGERFRKDYGDLEALKVSITSFKDVSSSGLLQPILVDRHRNLLAGGRRLRALTELGYERAPCVVLGEVDPIRAREIELEENLQRKDMTWDENCALIKEINDLKAARFAGQTKPSSIDQLQVPEAIKQSLKADPDYKPREVAAWGQVDTAALVGMSRQSVNRKIALAECLTIIPELKDADSENQAWKAVDRRIEELERELEYRRHKSSPEGVEGGRVLLGDCIKVLRELETGSIDCCIIDPPYGVLEEGGIHRYESGVHFDDSPTVALDVLKGSLTELRRVLKSDAHLYCFFGIKWFTETKQAFFDAGFTIDPIPLVWVKTTNSMVDFEHRYSNIWEPIFFYTNKQRRLAPGRHDNVFHYSSVFAGDRSNIAEKPIGLLRELILNSTKPGDLVLDCFAGSGSTGEAALREGRRYLLIEKDEGQWKHIQNRLAAVQSSLSADPTQDTQDKTSPSRETSLDDSLEPV